MHINNHGVNNSEISKQHHHVIIKRLYLIYGLHAFDNITFMITDIRKRSRYNTYSDVEGEIMAIQSLLEGFKTPVTLTVTNSSSPKPPELELKLICR